MITWSMWLAAITAGLIGGFHCVGMCGGIAQLLSRSLFGNPREQTDSSHAAAKTATVQFVRSDKKISVQRNLFYMHTGRLCTYVLIGAAFGFFGASLMRLQNNLIPQVFYIFGNLLLLWLSLRLLGFRFSLFALGAKLSGIISNFSIRLFPQVRRHPFITGLTWGVLPCGLSFAVAPMAILSGSFWAGGLLMLSFGLAALPHLLLTQIIAMRWRQSAYFGFLRITLAVLMMLVALLGLFYWDMKTMPDFLCLTPRSGA